MIRIALLGATGRMGTAVIDVLAADARFELTAALTGPDDPRLGELLRCGRTTVEAAVDCDTAFDALIDFSMPAGTMRWLDRCVLNRAAMIIGATGHSAAENDRIAAAAGSIPVLKASNFSLGVNLMLSLAADVARRLGDGYDIEIIEHHHNKKVDAPSGTAISLLDEIVSATGRDRASDVVFGREGKTGQRPPGQIGVHAVRMGAVVGHHEVHYSAAGETLTLVHTAHSRETFARGAVEAAAWIAGKPAGSYSMRNVVSG